MSNWLQFRFNTDELVEFREIPHQALFIHHRRLYMKINAATAKIIAWDTEYYYDYDLVSRINNVHQIPLDLVVSKVIDDTELNYSQNV